MQETALILCGLVSYDVLATVIGWSRLRGARFWLVKE